MYTNRSSVVQVGAMIIFDQSFKLNCGREETGSDQIISLIGQTRKLNLACDSTFDVCDWLISINKAVNNCEFLHNLFDRPNLSFAPERENCIAKWYVDGEDYYKDVYTAINQAKNEIFITDWFFSPELCLKRPVKNHKTEESRLDYLLQNMARKGVKIYIILFKENPLALPNDSERVKRHMESLDPNILVERHPHDFISYWSHHEKIVAIDQKVAFLGGLDLCFGRYDNASHHIFDPNFMKQDGEFWPGQDYSNVRIKDFIRDSNPLESLITKHTTPRMPWHDIALRAEGDVVKDVSRHFIQYWNYTRSNGKGIFLKPENLNVPIKIQHSVIFPNVNGSVNTIPHMIQISDMPKKTSKDFMQSFVPKTKPNVEKEDILYQNMDGPGALPISPSLIKRSKLLIDTYTATRESDKRTTSVSDISLTEEDIPEEKYEDTLNTFNTLNTLNNNKFSLIKEEEEEEEKKAPFKMIDLGDKQNIMLVSKIVHVDLEPPPNNLNECPIMNEEKQNNSTPKVINSTLRKLFLSFYES